MSQETVELVRAGFEAIERGDLALVQGMTLPGAVLVQPPEVPDAKTYEGADAIREAMEDWPTHQGGLRRVRRKWLSRRIQIPSPTGALRTQP